MNRVYLKTDSVLTPLGLGTELNFKAMDAGEIALKKFKEYGNFNLPFCAGILEDFKIQHGFTKLETMLMRVLNEVVLESGVSFKNSDTLLIIATTKGNIDILEKGGFENEREYLPVLANTLGNYYRCTNKPLIISNACVSGVSALILAQRLIAVGKFKQVVVCAADVVSEFVLSGFYSFNALSDEPCRPFDQGRKGINLGEAAAAALLSSEPWENNSSEILPGFGSNDANHISGPSRTGEGLYRCAIKTMEMHDSEVSFISAHGTATSYNDDMESIAFSRLQINHIATNSLKGYFGHTLGAAGLLEFILSNKSMHENKLIVSEGYKTHGVSEPLNIISKHKKVQLNSFLKTASGFGGTNAAIICKKC